MSDKASTKNVFMVNCHASIKGLFAGMIIFSSTVISIILYALFRNKIDEDMHHMPASSLHSESLSHHKIYSRASYYPVTPAYQYNFLIPTTTIPPHTTIRLMPKTPKKILYSIAIVEIVNFCLLCISLLATIWALVKIRKLQYKRTTTRKKIEQKSSRNLFFFSSKVSMMF